MSTSVVAVVVLLAIAAVVLLWKVMVTAGVIGGVQWLIVTHVHDVTVQVITFAVPAVLVAFLLTRLFAVRPVEARSVHHARSLKGAVR